MVFILVPLLSERCNFNFFFLFFNHQAVIRRALSESGCPPHIIDQLMENAHERRWPPGLSTLETRQVREFIVNLKKKRKKKICSK